MPLVDSQIRALMERRMIPPGVLGTTFREGTGGKGLISSGVTSAGYDFRLASTVKLYEVPRAWRNVGFVLRWLRKLAGTPEPVIDPKRINPALFRTLPVERELNYYEVAPGHSVMREEQFVTLPAYGYCLAETMEYIDIPTGYEVIVVGKSTYARSGIIVNCTPLEPGWRGVTTLEIANATPLPARLYIGEGIAQAKFYKLDETPEKDYQAKGFGKYQDQTGLTLPRV